MTNICEAGTSDIKDIFYGIIDKLMSKRYQYETRVSSYNRSNRYHCGSLDDFVTNNHFLKHIYIKIDPSKIVSIDFYIQEPNKKIILEHIDYDIYEQLKFIYHDFSIIENDVCDCDLFKKYYLIPSNLFKEGICKEGIRLIVKFREEVNKTDIDIVVEQAPSFALYKPLHHDMTSGVTCDYIKVGNYYRIYHTIKKVTLPKKAVITNELTDFPINFLIFNQKDIKTNLKILFCKKFRVTLPPILLGEYAIYNFNNISLSRVNSIIFENIAEEVTLYCVLNTILDVDNMSMIFKQLCPTIDATIFGPIEDTTIFY